MAKKKQRADGALATNNKARYNYAIAETLNQSVPVKSRLGMALSRFVMAKLG